MRAGRLRHKVTIQKDTGTTRTTQGGVVASWSTHMKWWARVVPLAGREEFESSQKFSETRYRFEGRHVSKPDDPTGEAATTPKMRLLLGTRTFDVVSVIDVDERMRETHIEAVERTT